MDLSEDRLRKTYADLDTDSIIENIDRGTLTPLGLEIAKEELSRRQVELPVGSKEAQSRTLPKKTPLLRKRWFEQTRKVRWFTTGVAVVLSAGVGAILSLPYLAVLFVVMRIWGLSFDKENVHIVINRLLVFTAIPISIYYVVLAIRYIF